MRVALAHDYLVERGGAEKVLAALHEVFPEAPVYTAVFNPDTTLDAFRGADVRTSFLQRLGPDPSRYRAYLPLYPLAFRRFDLQGYDLVISSASAFAKGVRKGPDARHVCYCHTPPRFVWQYQEANQRERHSFASRLTLAALRPWLERVDRAGAAGVDRFLANSQHVAARIAFAYGARATVLPPPIACAQFTPSAQLGDFFLVLSRLVPYKRIDVVVEAFNRMRWPLLIVGDGRDRPRLERLARFEGIQFLGFRSDSAVRALLSSCQALIVPGEEDFGMTALEANASGRPVIAYGAGGALETVRPGETGITFAEQDVDALLAALDEFQRCAFDTETLLSHARRFDTSRFQSRILDVASEVASPRQDGTRPNELREVAA